MLNCRTKEQVKFLIDKGHDINTCDNFGNTLVHKAVVYRDAKFLTDLLDLGANPRIKNMNGETPIFYAVTKEIDPKTKIPMTKVRKELVNILINHSGPVLYTDFNNKNKNYFSKLLDYHE
jgi:ankyrin repeat protein